MPSKPPVHRPAGYKPPDIKRREYDRARSAEKNAIYDAGWRRCSRLFLAAHPRCEHPGCGEAATDADHIESPRERPELRLSWSNLRAYCHPHHSARTSREQSWNRKKF